MMVDNVICEYALPIQDVESRMESPPNWLEFEYQTDSFRKQAFWIDDYSIEDDGIIYKKVVRRELIETEDGFSEIQEVEDGIERVDYTGELDLFGLHMEKDYDFEIEIKLLYYKGEMKEVASVDHKKTDNAKRKESIEAIKNFSSGVEDKKNKWWHPIAKIYNGVIGIFSFIIKYFFGLIIKWCWIVENFLKIKL